MRIYSTFEESHSEIRRDLGEMGIRVHTQTMQDKNISGDDNFATVELQNYQYCVTDASKFSVLEQHPSAHPDWMRSEWWERWNGAQGFDRNPGEAWKKRANVWREFLEADGRFSYQYGQRMSFSLSHIVNRLSEDKFSRQLFLSIWDIHVDPERFGKRRVPCSLGYFFLFREGRLDITYLQRSADFHTHFVHDQWMACRLLATIAAAGDVPMGRFIHWVGSLHVYQKDLGHVF